MGLLIARHLATSLLSSAIAFGAAFAAATVLSSCYSPALDDCAVECRVAEDCGPDQECSAGWCAGSDHVGACEGPGPGEPPPPGPTSALTVTVTGQGEVEVRSSAASLSAKCVAPSASGITCTYPVPSGTWISMNQKGSGGWKFEGWDSFGCTVGRPKSCLVRVGDTTTTVGARFNDD